MPKHNVVLVPGFFGFGALGDLLYFHGIRAVLEHCFERRGLSVNVTEVQTLPTASIRVRAARVQEALAAIAASTDGPIHIVGHSTGGLDARLAIAPTASLPTRVPFHAHARVHTLITVCTCHFGSPLATFFSSGSGRWVLRVVTRYLIWVLKRRRLPLSFFLRFTYWLVKLWSPFRRRPTTFDELYAKLLLDLSVERRAELVQFLEAVSSDESLVFQLTPAGCDLINACTAEPEIRYGSVVARAPKPSFRRYLRTFGDLYAQLMYPVYWFLHRVAARYEARWIPEAIGQQRERLIELLGELPSPRDNDGVVPTNSQIWGEVIHATTADHLDVVGHFGRAEEAGYAGDWLPTQSAFDAEAFESLWNAVAEFISDDIHRELTPGPTTVGTERTAQDLPGNAAVEVTK